MPAYRCSDCGGLNWPYEDRYRTCRKCGVLTSTMSNAEPMSKSEANHIEFEAVCDELDRKARAEMEALADAIARLPEST